MISVPPGTEMFQFPGFASHAYEFGVRYLSVIGGFPHSDIPGSKLVCQLPEAFRRLLRPSSPPTAKASTVCACSLDHITPNALKLYVTHAAGLPPGWRLRNLAELLKIRARLTRSARDSCAKPRALDARGGAREDRTPDLLRAKQALSQLSYGPAMVGLAGVEPATSPLSGVRSNRLSYRPARQITCVDAPRPRTGSRLGKEVIQPQVPLRLPCYDFTPVIDHTVVSALPKVKLPTSGATNSHGVTGGVYKARERIHRDMLIRDY